MRSRLSHSLLLACTAIAWLALSLHAAAPALRPQYVVDTLADLESLDPRVVSSGGRAHVGVRGNLASGDWGAVRWFSWNRTATNAVGAHYRTNVLAIGRWVSDDAKARAQDPRWWGLAGDGTTDDSPALNAAAAYARANGLGLVIPRAPVEYLCASQLDFRDLPFVTLDDLDDDAASGGGIRTAATGAGVLLGGTSTQLQGGRYKLKVVRYPADWTEGNSCVRVTRMQASHIELTAWGADAGLSIAPGSNEWVTYVTIRFGSIGWCRKNVAIEPTGSGYANYNVLEGGQLTLALSGTNEPIANVFIGLTNTAQAEDNIFREIDFNGRVDAFTNGAMFAFRPAGSTVAGALGNRVVSGRFEVGAGVKVPMLRVLPTATTNQVVDLGIHMLKYDTAIYSIVTPEGSEHYPRMAVDARALWVSEGNRRSLFRPIPSPVGLGWPLYIDGFGGLGLTNWGSLRAPGRVIYDLLNGRETNRIPDRRIAAPGGSLAAWESTNYAIGQIYTKALYRETFLELTDEVPIHVICWDTNGAPLGGTAPAYVSAKAWSARTNGVTPFYAARGGWLWLHPDVASVFIGYAPWLLGRDVYYQDLQVSHLFGATLTLRSPSGLTESIPASTGPPRTPHAVGALLADADGLGYRQATFDFPTTATAAGAFGTNTIFVASTTGVQTNDLVSVQTPSDTIAGLPRIFVSQVTAVTATNVTVSPLMGAGIESGAVVRFQRWRHATNSWGSAAYRDVPSTGDANSEQAVLGSDSRLDDARVPVEHGHVINSITNATELGKVLMGAPDRFVVLTNLSLRAAGGLGLDIDAPAQLYFRTNYSANIEGTAFRRINFIDTARIAFTALGDPASADEIVLSSDVRSGSITTNHLAAAAISYLLDRGSHTGSQAISTITGLQTALDQKQGTNAILTQLAVGNGISLTNLNADGISSGTLADARIPSAIARDSEMALLYQPLDPSLTEIAGFSGIAGQMPYHDGTSFTPLVSTVAGRALLTAADAAAQRSSLGLGTAATRNVPASGNASSSEAVLGSDSRLNDPRTPTAHTHPASEISDSTTAGRALLTAANASAQRASLELGTLALINDAPSDSTIYGRSNATWVPVSGATGGGTSTSAPVALTLMVSTAAVTVTNSVTNETSIATSVTANSVTNLDAGTLTSGTLLRARLHGTLSAPSANYGGTLRFKIGGYTASILVEEPSSYTPDGVAWSAEVNVLVSASGSSATVRSWGTFAFQSAPYATANEVGLRHTTGSGTLDTTATAAVSITWANANPGMDLTCSGVVVEILGKTVSVAGRTYIAGTNMVEVDGVLSVARSPSRMWAGGVGGGATNTTSECTVFDSTFPDLEDGDMVEFRVQGPYMVLAAASVQLRVRVYVNGVAVIDGNSPSVTSSTLVRPWNLLGYMQREGASSGHVSASLGISSSSPTTGIGSWTSAINSPRLVMGTNAAVAWGSNTNRIKVTITPSASSPTNSWSANWWIGR